MEEGEETASRKVVVAAEGLEWTGGEERATWKRRRQGRWVRA